MASVGTASETAMSSEKGCQSQGLKRDACACGEGGCKAVSTSSSGYFQRGRTAAMQDAKGRFLDRESKKEGWKTRSKLKKHQCGTGAGEIKEKESGSFYAGSKKLICHLHCNTNGLWGDKFNRLSLYNL